MRPLAQTLSPADGTIAVQIDANRFDVWHTNVRCES